LNPEIPVVDSIFAEEHPSEAAAALLRPEGALILMNKQYGDTSFYVVNRLRMEITRATGIRRVKCGHAGTLDPLATGLLILATRGATKQLAHLIGLDKMYFLKMRFGITSASFDLERPIEIVGGEDGLTEESVRKSIESLLGEHSQIPPQHSAIKQQGQPVYKKARAGHEVALAPRTVVVHSVEVVSIDLPYASFRVRVSKGTYIRSLVRDLAESLGTAGILVDLVRESIADWNVARALSLKQGIDLIEFSKLDTKNISVASNAS